MLTYNVEQFKVVAIEMVKLWHEHWLEIAHEKDKIGLSPNIEKYLIIEGGGNLLLVTARDEGVLVGYSIMFVDNHIHYSDTKVAINDVLYLSTKYRKGMAGVRLIKVTEAECRKLGVKKIFWHIKTDHNFGPIMERLGYKPAEINYTKYIGE
jgi:N-acetylglutamate synthase-like GNAT family acetyltransferase